MKNIKLLFSMVKNDFINRFANTSLGAVWGFISPFVLIFMYAIVFEYIMKLDTAGEYPYLVWFLPGIVMWNFLSEAVLQTTNSIREYSYLVKKIVFPIDVIPLIKVFSSATVALFMLVLVLGISLILGYVPNIIMLLYYIVSALFFVISLTRITSTLAVMLGDFIQFIPVLMQVMFWATPVVWNINIAEEGIANIVKLNPFTYLVCGFRETFTSGNIFSENSFIFTIVFWVINILLYLYSKKLFKTNKNEFADVI